MHGIATLTSRRVAFSGLSQPPGDGLHQSSATLFGRPTLLF